MKFKGVGVCTGWNVNEGQINKVLLTTFVAQNKEGDEAFSLGMNKIMTGDTQIFRTDKRYKIKVSIEEYIEKAEVEEVAQICAGSMTP